MNARILILAVVLGAVDIQSSPSMSAQTSPNTLRNFRPRINAAAGGAVHVRGAVWMDGSEQVEPKAKGFDPAVPTQQKLIIRSKDLFPLTKPTRLGVFTPVPPQTNGEVIRLSIPVGEFATRAAHAISDARRHHAERKVDERIAHELRVFNLHRADTPP
jgi:hypothetical protein